MKTSGELVATARKLTEAAAGRFGLAYSYGDFYYHAALMNGFGGGVFDAQRKPTLNRPENIKALDLRLRWANQDGILPAEPSTAVITSLFNEGKAAMVSSGPWFLGEIAKGVDYGLAPLPKLDEAGGKPMRPGMTVEGVYVAATFDQEGRRVRLRALPDRPRRPGRSSRSREGRRRRTRGCTTTRRSRPTRSSGHSASRSRSRFRCPTFPR